MKKINTPVPAFLCVLLASLFLIPSSAAQLQCDVRNSPCGGSYPVDMLHMYNITQSHAELPSQNSYSWRVCCGGVDGLNNIKQGTRGVDYDIILKLWNQSNSHVQENTESGYPYESYISVDSGGIEVRCNYTTSASESCSMFGADYACLATIAQANNSHIADCDGTDDLPIKVCCKAEADTIPPSFSITEPSTRWIAATNWTVSWTATDNYGVKCSNVVWSLSSSGPWNYITSGGITTSCTLPSDSIKFGPSEPTSVEDGRTYYFSGNATDINGNTGPLISPVVATADISSPTINLTARDGNGNLLIGGYVPANVTLINITSEAMDNVSGVMNHRIVYWLTQNNQHTYGEKDCGPASPWGGWSNCSISFSYDDDTIIKYYAEATDRAGNVKRTRTMFTTSHPLANFEIHKAYLSMGESMLLPVQVRNIQTATDNITLGIDSSFVSANPEFVDSGTGEYDISGPNNDILNVYNLNPMEERRFYIKIYPGETGKYIINITASSNIASPGLMDSDGAEIEIGYPASFPGLTWWSIVAAISLSLLLLPFAERYIKHKQ